jgi:ketosteroid isomerase-like protein
MESSGRHRWARRPRSWWFAWPALGSLAKVFREDVESLREAYQAFNERGVEAILERLAPEFEVRDRESSPDRDATRYGQEGIKQLFDSYMEAFDALRLEPQDFTEAGDQIIVSLHQRVRGKGSGAEVVGNIAHVWKMRQGAPFRLRIFGDKDSALEALRAEGALPGDRL